MEKSRQGGLRILFADDEAHLRDLMQMELPRLGHEVTVCPDGTAALRALERGLYDAALLDLRMPGLTGIEVLGQIRQISPETQVIILTGHATVDTAVQALRLGAFDYLTKPCKWAELEMILNRVAERRDMANKTTALETRLKAAEGTPLLIGETPAMQQVRRLIDTIAPTDASVMILGETGTGKELVARSLHDKSRRADRGVHPGQLRRPARKPGRERALRPPQGSLHRRRHQPQGTLRGRQRRHALPRRGRRARQERAGQAACGSSNPARSAESARTSRSASTSASSARPIATCATWSPTSSSAKTCSSGSTRSRSTCPLCASAKPTSPRWRKHMLARHASRRGLTESAIAPESIELLMAHDWPGNIRELANMIERATILAGNGPILPEHLPTQLPARSKSHPSTATAGRGPSFPGPRGQPDAPRRRDEIHPDDPRETQRQQTRRLARAGDQPQDALQQDQSASAQLSP